MTDSTSSTTNIKDQSDEKLKDLITACNKSAQTAADQAGTFFGSGFQQGADEFNKVSETFTKLAQEAQDELDSRKKEAEEKATKAADKKGAKEQQSAAAAAAAAEETKTTTAAETKTAETKINTTSSTDSGSHKSRF